MAMDETFVCTIHDVEFGIGWRGRKKDGAYAECPLCLKDELVKRSREQAEVIKQRDALLGVIDMKQTIIRHQQNAAQGVGEK